MSKRDTEEKEKGNTLLNYFKKFKKDPMINVNDHSECLKNTEENQDFAFRENQESQSNLDTSLKNVDPTVSTIPINSIDIGTFLSDLKTVDDFTRYQILTNHWIPDKNYTFPFSSHMKRGREEKRRANHGHLEKHKWLVISKSKQGLFCKFCALFLSDTLVGGQKTILPRKLVTEPLVNFAKLTGVEGDLHKHEITNYHTQAIEKGMYKNVDTGCPVCME